jgi:hypothetical protein
MREEMRPAITRLTAPRARTRVLHSSFHHTEDSMTRTLRTLALALCGVVTLAGGAGAQAAKGTCRADDEMSARIVQYFQGVVTPQTPAAEKLRDDLGLAGVTAAQVVTVSDTRACAAAGRAMDRLAETRKDQYALYVVKVGDSYGVVEPTWRSGEWVPAIVFDRHWKMRKMLLAF